MTERTDDWTHWRATWRAEARPEEALRHALAAGLRRYRRRLVLTIAVEVAVTVEVLVLVAARLRAQPDLAAVIWAVWCAVFITTVWVVAVRSRRGLWAPLGESAEAFLEVTRRRAERQLRTVRFVVGATAAQSAATGAWLLWRFGLDPTRWGGAAVQAWGLLALIMVASLTWCSWQRSRCRRDLALLQRLAPADPPHAT